jgi:hypothetical protein
MSDTTTTTPYPQAGGKLPSEHDGFAIASLVTAFFVPILAIIFGHLSNHRANLAHRAKSALAVTGLVLGYVFTGITALIIVIVVAVAGSTTPSVSANAAPPPTSAPASHAPKSSAPAAPATSAPAAQAPAPAAAPAFAPKVLYTGSGTGQWNSAPFTVANTSNPQLKVTFSYSGNATDGSADNMMIDVKSSGDDLSLANDIAVSGGKTTYLYPDLSMGGSSAYHVEVDGTGYVKITITQVA